MRAPSLSWASLVLAIATSADAAAHAPGGGRQPTGAQIVAPPAGLDLAAPIAVTRWADGSYHHSFDVTTRRPRPTVTIFVGRGGDNARDCLSWAHRCRSLKQAMTRAGAQPDSQVIRILAQAGIYRASSVDQAGIADDFGGYFGARNLVIEPCDASGKPLPASNGQFSMANQIVSSHDVVMPAYFATSDARIFVSSYTTQTPDRAMWDEKHTNRFGRPLGLLPVPANGVANISNPIAEINKAAELGKGAFFLDRTNKKLWVRLSDDRKPDAQVFASSAGRQLYLAIGQNKKFSLYMRNVDQWGGYFQLNGWPNSSTWQISFVDTYSGYVTNGAYLITSGGSVLWKRSVVSDYFIDAFGTGTESAEKANIYWYELDTIAEWGGFGQTVNDGSANASTQHRNSVGMSVNTTYRYNTNRTVHDIGNARSWRLGMTIGPSTRAMQKTSGLITTLSNGAKASAVAVASGYYDETGPQTAQVWVDGLKIIGPMNYALGAYNNINGGGGGGTLYYRHVMVPEGIGNTTDSPYAGQEQHGTIQSY